MAGYPKKVVVTGMGAVTPIGLTLQDYWSALLAGKSGVGQISKFNPEGFATTIAAELKNFNPEDYIDRKEARRMDPFCQYAMAAAAMALDDAKLDLDKVEKDRVGVIVGSGIGGMYIFEDQVITLETKGVRRLSPFFIPIMILDMAAGQISIRYGFKGPNFATVSACATASHAIGAAFDNIRLGRADVVVTGGTEAPITRMGIGGFNAMKALSTRNAEPERASRPFDAQRDGFVCGEGGGILILEAEEHAVKRGARIYAEIAGVGFTADAFHITAPSPGGEGAIHSMKMALDEAGVAPQDVQYINAHGTSTELNDKNETEAIKGLFGDYAYKLKISSTKSMIGHLLGAAGAVEAVATIMSIVNGKIHPTINYEFPDPECDLDYTPNYAVDLEIENALSNTFGFGGHNATLLFKKYRS